MSIVARPGILAEMQLRNLKHKEAMGKIVDMKEEEAAVRGLLASDPIENQSNRESG